MKTFILAAIAAAVLALPAAPALAKPARAQANIAERAPAVARSCVGERCASRRVDAAARHASPVRVADRRRARQRVQVLHWPLSGLRIEVRDGYDRRHDARRWHGPPPPWFRHDCRPLPRHPVPFWRYPRNW